MFHIRPCFFQPIPVLTILTYCLFLQAAPAGVSAAVRPAPPRKSAPPARHGRDTRVIDDNWTYRTDPSRVGETQGWTKSPPADSHPVIVPSLWTVSGAPGYSGVAWYWRSLDPPGAWLGQTVRLRFEAVAENADLWLNGEKLGSHRGGATPFEFNITKTIKIGAKNMIAVRVEGQAERGAGIWQGVLLMAHDEAYISDIFPYGGPLGNLQADIELINTSDKSGGAELDVRILTSDTPGKEIKKSGQILSLTPKRNVTSMLVNVPKNRLMPWSPNSPSLYYFDLAFHQDKDVLDTTESTIGFRELGWKDGAITVNGAAFTPKAVAPELTLPVVIATEEDRNRARALLKKLKDSGITVVYLEAPPPTMLALADEVGLLIVESARAALAPADAQAELLELIRRDRAHASILAWKVRGTENDLVSPIRKLDPTRFVLIGSGKDTKLIPPHPEDARPFPPPPGLLPR